MKTILIITNGTLPVPASKGGAVENLVQILLDHNEIQKDFKFIVFSTFESKALQLGASYKNSHFVFINSDNFLYKIKSGIRFFINRILPVYTGNQFIHEVLKHERIIRKTDLILVENNPHYLPILRRKTKITMGLHLHNDYLNIQKKSFSKNSFENSSFVISVSDYIKKRVLELAPKNYPVERVYNGIDLEQFGTKVLPYHKKSLKKKYGILEDEVIILFTGRLQKSKGIDVLLEAFIEMSDKFNSKLLIVGGSAFKDSKNSRFITQLKKTARKEKNIIFTGYIPYTEIQHFYNLADFAVIPSLAPEAFGLTVLEALASGLPVIVTDAGGIPETINEKCGYILKRNRDLQDNLKNHMEKLISDKNLRHKMAIEAKNQAKKFSDTMYYDNLKHCLKSLM